MSASDEKELDDAIAIATNFAEMSALGMVLDKYVEYLLYNTFSWKLTRDGLEMRL